MPYYNETKTYFAAPCPQCIAEFGDEAIGVARRLIYTVIDSGGYDVNEYAEKDQPWVCDECAPFARQSIFTPEQIAGMEAIAVKEEQDKHYDPQGRERRGLFY